jgi:hypothetical protein
MKPASFFERRPMSEEARVLPFERPLLLSHQHIAEARQFCLRIVRDRTYQAALLRAAQKRELPPAIEQMVWAYAYGKPPNRLEVGSPGSFQEFEGLPVEDLVLRAREIAERLEGLSESSSNEASKE